jgi:hypothetical protein
MGRCSALTGASPDPFSSAALSRATLDLGRLLSSTILSKVSAGDRELINEISRVRDPAEAADTDFANTFDAIDAATCDLPAVLGRLDAQITFIRETRDEVHARLMTWAR